MVRLFFTYVLSLFLAFISISFQNFNSQTNTATIHSTNGWDAKVKIVPIKIITTGKGVNCNNVNSYTIPDYHYEIEYQMTVIFTGSTNSRSITIQQYFDCALGQGNALFAGAYNYTSDTTVHIRQTNNSGYNVVGKAVSGQANVYTYAVPCFQANLKNTLCTSVKLVYWGNGINNGNKVIDNIGISPLPVQLLDFSAEVVNQSVEINWVTASERNNDYFTIEKTTDGINYEAVAKVDGVGNSTANKNYSYTDYSPSKGVSYYRLTQTDFNGQKEVFEPKSVEIGLEKSIITNVYPNPAVDSKINVVVTESGTVVINIYNLFGQLVKTQLIESHQSNVTEQIELPEEGNTFFVELIQNNLIVGRHKVLTTIK